MEREPKTARERALLLLRATLLPGRRPPTASQVLVWAIRGAIVLGVLVLIASVVDKALWDWLDLLIVPAVIAGGGIWFNRQQQERQREDNRQQQERELEIADQRAQGAALEAYLDQIGQLLLDKETPLRKSEEGDEVRTLARARTKEVLWKLSPNRKRNVLQFLYEACLIKRDCKIIDLSGADLRDAYLWNLDLGNADLRGADMKSANLSEANLSGADLRGSMLGGAELRGAYLSGADLWDAREWTDDQLTAAHLEGATMPNGQKYEDWLKSKGSKEHGEGK